MTIATLRFIESKHEPVFKEKQFLIEFDRLPNVGQPFVFRAHGTPCNLSRVKRITYGNGRYIIFTKNSVYELIP